MMIAGTWPAAGTPNFEQIVEVPAIAEENKFRAQVGVPQRHPTDHWGEPGAAPPGDKPFPLCKEPVKSFWGCLVATAATGTSAAPEVQALRDARDRWRNLNGAVACVAGVMLDAYRQVSPFVVRRMHSDPALRASTLVYGVKPLFHLARVVDEYVRAEAEAAEVSSSISAAIDEYLQELSCAGRSAHELRQATDGAARAAEAIGVPREGARGDEWPANLFPYFADLIRSRTPDAAGFEWAFAGVADFLAMAAERAEDDSASVEDYLARLRDWLAAVPVPLEAVPEADLRSDLAILSERLFTRPELRAAFAQALVARSSPAERGAVQAVLADVGYTAEVVQ